MLECSSKTVGFTLLSMFDVIFTLPYSDMPTLMFCLSPVSVGLAPNEILVPICTYHLFDQIPVYQSVWVGRMQLITPLFLHNKLATVTYVKCII